MDKKIKAYLMLKNNPEMLMSEIDHELNLSDTVRKWKSREFKEIVRAEQSGLEITEKVKWKDIKAYNKSQKNNCDMTQKETVTSQKIDDKNVTHKKIESSSLVEEIIDPVLESENANSSYKVFSEKEKEFIRYYFLYIFNIKAATLKAGYAFENEGSRLLRKPKIKRAINLIRLGILEKDNLNMTPEYLIEELHTNLLKASGELPQVKTFLIDQFDKETLPTTVRTFEGKLRDGTTVEGTEVYGELEKGSFKDVVKNEINEKSYQKPEEFMIRDTDLKSFNMTAKLIADLYGYTDSSKLARERFEHEKEISKEIVLDETLNFVEDLKDGDKTK